MLYQLSYLSLSKMIANKRIVLEINEIKCQSSQVRKMSSASVSSPAEEGNSNSISTSNNNDRSNNDAKNNATVNNNNNNKRMDINEFISAMLYRTRKGEYK